MVSVEVGLSQGSSAEIIIFDTLQAADLAT